MNCLPALSCLLLRLSSSPISRRGPSGIGGLSTATLGWGDPEKGGVKTIPVDQKCELASLIGNIAIQRGKVYVHAHAVVSFSDGSTKGGHMVDAHANPFVEIFVVTTDSPAAATSSR